MYDPILAERLRSHSPADTMETLSSPTGQPSLRVNRDGHTYLLHSSRDPMREAARWVNDIKLPTVYNLIVLGCGMMYHVYQLVMKTQGTLRNLVVIEKNTDVVHAVFSHIDLAPFLQTKTTFFLVDPTPSDIRHFMNRHLTPMTLDGVEIVEHPASCALDPEFYRETRVVIDECLQSGEMLLRTKVQLGGMIQENIIRNLPFVFQNPAASALGSLLAGAPAFVVGAGPSLDWNINKLQQVKDRGIIIAVDTVFKKLRNNGIEPHIVVTSDPTPLNARHFEGIDDLRGTILAFSPSVYHKIPKQLFGTMVSLPLPSSKFLLTMKDVLGDLSYLSIGTNAGQACFNLAVYMGCDPIVLVGMDLAFPRDGGSTHASDTALRRRITLSESPGKMMVELIGNQPELEEFSPIFVPGNLGGEVATNKFWFAYRRSLEEAVARIGARVINCTEGGARIEGTEIRTLSETIQEVCVRDAMVSSTLGMSVGFFFGPSTHEGVSVLRESLTILKLAAEKATTGLEQVEALRTACEASPLNVDHLQHLLREIKETHLALVQDQKVYVVLDEASDKVLTPFLQQKSRPDSDRATPENGRMIVKRYHPYFTDMKELCLRFSTFIQETLDQMDTMPFGF